MNVLAFKINGQKGQSHYGLRSDDAVDLRYSGLSILDPIVLHIKYKSDLDTRNDNIDIFDFQTAKNF